MKKLRLLSVVGITSIALAHAGWAAGHGGGGGGFHGGGGFGGGGGGHFGGGGGGRAAGIGRGGGVGFSGARFAPGTPRISGTGPRLSSVQTRQSGIRSTSAATGLNRRPSQVGSTARQRGTVSGTRAAGSPDRRTNIVAERHDGNWHHGWDRRHPHFFHNRFFVFDDGFWFGLDDGFYPWDYYGYDEQDYYAYNASTDPYSVSMVSAVQSDLAEQGYYHGVIDGVYGPQTRAALTRYQSNHGLQVTGSLTPATLQSLGLPQPMGS
jgi:putative peptidoglycan binding protein